MARVKIRGSIETPISNIGRGVNALEATNIADAQISAHNIDSAAHAALFDAKADQIDLDTTNQNVLQNKLDISSNAQAISSLDNRVTTSEGDISNIQSDYVSKAINTTPLVASVTQSVTSTGALQQVETRKDIRTGSTDSLVTIPVPVTNTAARLFLPQEQQTLQDVAAFVAASQGQSLFYEVDLSGIPSGAPSDPAVQSYLTNLYQTTSGQSTPLDRTVLEDANLNIAYRWSTNSQAWYFIQASTIGIATNNLYDANGNLIMPGNQGLIIGTNKRGGVLIETNGEGFINGFDDLEVAIQNNSNAISTEVTNRTTAVNTVASDLQSEVQRAMLAEQINAEDISNETTNRINAGTVLQHDIDTRVPQSRTVAGKALTSDVTLDSLTIQRNGTIIGAAYDGSGARTVNIVVPTQTSGVTNNGDGTLVGGQADPFAKVSQIPTTAAQMTMVQEVSRTNTQNLPANTNLGIGTTVGDNSARTAGQFLQNSVTWTNAPLLGTQTGRLEVIANSIGVNTNNVIQIYTHSTGRQWRRSLSGNPATWTAWRENISTAVTLDTSSTAAGTAAKTTSVATGYTRNNGSLIRVMFANQNTAIQPTLDFQGSGAANIVRALANPFGAAGGRISALEIGQSINHLFMFDGTNWVLINPNIPVPTETVAGQAGSVGIDYIISNASGTLVTSRNIRNWRASLWASGRIEQWIESATASATITLPYNMSNNTYIALTNDLVNANATGGISNSTGVEGTGNDAFGNAFNNGRSIRQVRTTKPSATTRFFSCYVCGIAATAIQGNVLPVVAND
jgi:hypothetical protein